jgi:hypothetical protein
MYGLLAQMARDARDKAIQENLAAGKSQAEAEAVGEVVFQRENAATFSSEMRSLTYGATGAAIGSVVPGVGTLVGFVIGSVYGAFQGAAAPNPAKDALNVAKMFVPK